MSISHTETTADTLQEKAALQTSGVQELIDRIRRDGVSKGHDEGEAVIAAARAEAVQILDRANKEGEQILSAARIEAARVRKSADDALRLAARDAVLALGEALRTDFLN